MKTQTPFDIKTGKWAIAWPGRVSRHDLVYLSPPTDPMDGIPLGNGDIGALCWCENSKLIFAINKCDLWDDAKFGQFHSWSREGEEKNTTLRHACKLVLDFKLPIFDSFYLSEFNGRLSLADASLTISATGAFGTIAINAFISYQHGTLCCNVKSKLKENSPMELVLERFGSRTFSHWYSQINRRSDIGLQGTKASVDDGTAYITHELTSGKFAAGCRIIEKNDLNISYATEHSHASKIVMSGKKDKIFTLALAVTSPITGNPVNTVKKKLEEVKDNLAAFKIHKKEWKNFWLRSLMESGNDYFDKLWHLTMYYANASQRGKYPGRFINGLWGWNRDVQPWNFYFHWNQQQIYWPLNAAGHHDLLDSYLNFRFNSLSLAKEDAQKVCHADGAIISDVSERRGYNSVSEFLNHAPIAQIAMDFYRQYKFTGDKEFLRKQVYPFIKEAACFFESLFEKGKDGIYHAKEGTGYEGWIKLRDCVSELVYGKVLLSAAIDVSNECGIKDLKTQEWQDIINGIAPLVTVEAENDCFKNEEGSLKFNRGSFNGDTAFSNKVLAAGFGIAEKKWLTSKLPSTDKKRGTFDGIYEIIQKLENNQMPYSDHQLEDMAVYSGIFPGVEYSSVYPSGMIGLSQEGTDLYMAAVDTAKLYAPDCMGWDPLPIVLARLGLANELSRILQDWPSRWQFYCNGFGHYGPKDIMKAESSLKYRTYSVKDVSQPPEEIEKNKFPFPGRYADKCIYDYFRRFLWSVGISHGGRGHGPRIHDFRHSQAVHCLKKWVKRGEDLTAMLPYLSAYLGHVDLRASQYYLRLTADLYPSIVSAVETNYPNLIPEVNSYERD